MHVGLDMRHEDEPPVWCEESAFSAQVARIWSTISLSRGLKGLTLLALAQSWIKCLFFF